MKPEILFPVLIILLLSKFSHAVYVDNLKPDVDCDALLASKAAEREKDPTLVSQNMNFHWLRSVTVNI